MIKYANNILLATQISMMNEIANLSNEVGRIDVMQVVGGVTLDKRWSPEQDGKRVKPGILNYLVPGCGFGGSCFPKDVQAIRAMGKSLGVKTHMMDGIVKTNARQPSQVSKILYKHVGSIKDKTIGILGLAFKPGTDDVRESASIKIASELVRGGSRLIAHDPEAKDNFKKVMDKKEN